MGVTAGVDVGGTKVAVGVVDAQGTILARRRRASVANKPGEVEKVIAALVGELAREHPIEAVGVGAAGFVDETRSVVRFAPNLGWREQPVRAQLEALLGLPVVVENDANAAAWGEYRFGAAREHRDVALITVGTGIGGGLVADGALYRGGSGLAGEVGHLRLVHPDGRPCGCGRTGCWEQYASGSALVREARALALADRAGAAHLLELGDGTPEAIRGRHVTIAAKDGDPVAGQAFVNVGSWLGRGMAELSAVLDPSCFVVGGGVSDAGDLLLEPARATFAAEVVAAQNRPPVPIVLATLRNDAGIVGAADLARHR